MARAHRAARRAVATTHVVMTRTHSHCKVMVEGEVERPRTFDLRDLAGAYREEVTLDFHCHEGWTRLGESYRGVALATVLELVGARPAARYVTVASGGYTVGSS